MTAFKAARCHRLVWRLCQSRRTHTHLNPVCETSHRHHFRSCKSSVWTTKGAIYLSTGIHFYGSFRPTFFTQFFLKLRERSINLILCQIFSTTFPVDLCTWKSAASVQCSVFNYCGGRRERKTGIATQLIGSFLSHDSLLLIVAKGFLSLFLSPLGSLCTKRKILNDKPRLQVPCRGRRPAGIAAAAPATTPSTGMTE